MLKKLLWADDQPEFVASVRGLIEADIVELRTCSDGEEAARLIRSWKPDAVLLDLKMPPGEWGGLRCLQILGDEAKRLPIIVLSGAGTITQCMEAINLGATNCW